MLVSARRYRRGVSFLVLKPARPFACCKLISVYHFIDCYAYAPSKSDGITGCMIHLANVERLLSNRANVSRGSCCGPSIQKTERPVAVFFGPLSRKCLGSAGKVPLRLSADLQLLRAKGRS